ncbi:MAG: hypothetical protein RBS43_04605 [Candidatus Cloacimonas sp.]|jgi:hypothetical protein|nr:hypothetical protein [Candidatus Cloacimonas sp.]
MGQLLFTVFFLLFNVSLHAVMGYALSLPVVNDTKSPSVILLNPQPNDIWYIDQIEDITWTAADTNLLADSIYIYLSVDAGVTFNPLAGPLANTGTYSWQLPAVACDISRLRIKAQDSFGNYSQATNPLVLSYSAPPPMQVSNVMISITGNDALISWQAVTENVYHELIIPDGYILFESDTPADNPADFTWLANTTDTEYIYRNAPLQFERKFFYVVAFKDYRGRLRSLLQQCSEGKQLPLTLQDIRNLLGKDSKAGAK